MVLPLLVAALAGCGGGAAGASESKTPAAATSSASAESLIQKGVRSCKLDTSANSAYATVGDAGYTVTLKGEPADPNYANITKVTGLSARDMACVLLAAAVPDSVVSQIDATRALDGMQRASWDKMAASWTYHPKNGLNLILTESK
ncbi:MAG TPA: hypothetical protein VF867_19975 [Arthrobacter sp.]